jgi:5-methyltetrahydrofolate--homocysteine methyltransferase
LNIAEKLIAGLTAAGVDPDHIFVDPLVQPVSVNTTFGAEFLDAIAGVAAHPAGVHTACGLSNISYGLPERKAINRTFMAMAIARGLDGAIVDPLDRSMMSVITVAEALKGRDDFCMNYIQAYRAGKIVV